MRCASWRKRIQIQKPATTLLAASAANHPTEHAFDAAREIARPPLEQFSLFAPSVEEAKQLADDFLYCYDKVLLPRTRKKIEDRKAQLTKARDAAALPLAELEKKLAAAKSEAEGVESLNSATLVDLKTKRTLLSVEVSRYRRSNEKAAQSLRLCEEILADLTPFQLVDDTVVIRPLQFHVEKEGTASEKTPRKALERSSYSRRNQRPGPAASRNDDTGQSF